MKHKYFSLVIFSKENINYSYYHQRYHLLTNLIFIQGSYGQVSISMFASSVSEGISRKYSFFSIANEERVRGDWARPQPGACAYQIEQN